MSRLTRDGTAEPVSRDQILRHARGQENIRFPCSADHKQDWQPYPVDPYSAMCDDHTYIYAKRPDVALYTVGPLFLLPIPSSPHCPLKVSEYVSLWQSPVAHSDERPRPQKSSRTQRCLNTLAPSYLKGTVVRGHPVVWSLALRPMRRSKTGWCTVRSLAEGPRTASIQKGFDCFGLYHPGLEGERDFRLVVELL